LSFDRFPLRDHASDGELCLTRAGNAGLIRSLYRNWVAHDNTCRRVLILDFEGVQRVNNTTGLDVLAPFAALVAHSSDSMYVACDNVSPNGETAHDLLFMLHSCFDASRIVVAARRVGRGGLCDYYLLGYDEEIRNVYFAWRELLDMSMTENHWIYEKNMPETQADKLDDMERLGIIVKAAKGRKFASVFPRLQATAIARNPP
jgi:hypothetical protein